MIEALFPFENHEDVQEHITGEPDWESGKSMKYHPDELSSDSITRRVRRTPGTPLMLDWAKLLSKAHKTANSKPPAGTGADPTTGSKTDDAPAEGSDTEAAAMIDAAGVKIEPVPEVCACNSPENIQGFQNIRTFMTFDFSASKLYVLTRGGYSYASFSRTGLSRNFIIQTDLWTLRMFSSRFGCVWTEFLPTASSQTKNGKPISPA